MRTEYHNGIAVALRDKFQLMVRRETGEEATANSEHMEKLMDLCAQFTALGYNLVYLQRTN